MKKLFFSFLWYIPVFLAGSALSGYLFFHFRPVETPEQIWAKNHPMDVQWAMTRREIAEKALNELLSGEAQGSAISIITKDNVKTVK